MSQTQQQKQPKWQPCRNQCGVNITFDPVKGRTPTGGWIPMTTDSIGQLVIHDCPNKKSKPVEVKQQQEQQHQASPTDAVVTAVQSSTDNSTSSTNNYVAEIKVLLLQILKRLEHLEQVLVSHKR